MDCVVHEVTKSRMRLSGSTLTNQLGVGTHVSLPWSYILPSPLHWVNSPLTDQGALPGRGGAGRQETLHQVHFPPWHRTACWHVTTDVKNVKLWRTLCQFSYLNWHRGGFVGEFWGVSCCVSTAHPVAVHRDSGKAAHINSHKLPLQNVRIKSRFLFWGCASRMLTPSCG